MELSPSNSSNI